MWAERKKNSASKTRKTSLKDSNSRQEKALFKADFSCELAPGVRARDPRRGDMALALPGGGRGVERPEPGSSGGGGRATVPVSCVRNMAAKNHFNEIKKEKNQKNQKKPQTQTKLPPPQNPERNGWRDNHWDAVSKAVKSLKTRNTF